MNFRHVFNLSGYSYSLSSAINNGIVAKCFGLSWFLCSMKGSDSNKQWYSCKVFWVELVSLPYERE